MSHKIQIAGRFIGDGQPVYIIAEAGVNHNGDVNAAKRLIDVAAEAGADAVKFQAFHPDSLILESVEKAPYQKKTTNHSESQRAMLDRLAISLDENRELITYCNERGITFLTTPFDEKSLEDLDDLNLSAYKVASTDTTNLPFLRKVAQRRKPVFLSTGMSHLDEVAFAVAQFESAGTPLILLQCSADYPIEDADANLAVISVFRKRFGLPVGYSDHSVGIGAAPYAIPLGACVLEKHFCLDETLEGPDQRCSLNPSELSAFVREVRRVEKFMGNGLKIPSLAETGTRQALQKCLVASKGIHAGESFSEENLVAKRTGGKGISPLYFDRVCGRLATRNFSRNEIIEL